VLFILAGVKMSSGSTTICLTGFDPEARKGGPPKIIEGSNLTADDQVVLDGSFAAKYHIAVGDRLPINDDTLKVVGLSAGTNMFVIQYAFVTLKKAQTIAGFPSIVSCYLVKVEQGMNPNEVADQIRSDLPGVAVFDRHTFLQNNIREMESGFLPLLYVVAAIGAIVLTAILTLILSVNVLELRQDFAVMKAIGAPNGFIPKLVIQQALVLSGIGVIVAIVLFFPLVTLVEKVSPEVSAISSLNQIAAVTIGVGIISLISSIIPNRKLRKIYPLEVFR
jgi:putative ABC transport system permease protein